MNHRTLAAVLLLSLPGASRAGIIGMLWSGASSNVTLEATNEQTRPLLKIHVPNGYPCPIRLYRRDPEELTTPKTVELVYDENGVPGLMFGLWMGMDCVRQNGEREDSVQTIALDSDLLDLPAFAGHRDAFMEGRINVGFCLQQSAPGDYDQSIVCARASYKDMLAGKIIYQSKFSVPPPIDLGLTRPIPLREDLPLEEAAHGPSLKPGQSFVKDPSLSAKMKWIHVNPKDAYNQDEKAHQGFRYLRFYLYNGEFLDETRIREVARRGETFCEMILKQPFRLSASETAISIPPRDFPKMSASGGSTTFCCGKDRDDAELQRHDHWGTSIGPVVDLYTPVPGGRYSEDRTVLSHLACPKPRSGPAVTAKDFSEHLKIDGQSIISFYSDYPGYQKP